MSETIEDKKIALEKRVELLKSLLIHFCVYECPIIHLKCCGSDCFGSRGWNGYSDTCGCDNSQDWDYYIHNEKYILENLTIEEINKIKMYVEVIDFFERYKIGQSTFFDHNYERYKIFQEYKQNYFCNVNEKYYISFEVN